MDWTTVRRQGGVFSRDQARAWGASDRQLDRRLASGELVAAPNSWRGVLMAAGTPWNPHAALWAAILAIGEPAAVMGHTAAGLYRWCEPFGLVSVAVPRHRKVKAPAGVRLRRLELAEDDVTTWRGLPITSKPRTLVDCLRFLPPSRAGDVLDRALQRDNFDLVEVATRVSSRGPGTRQARRLLSAVDGAAFAAERLMAQLMHQADIAGWVANLAVQLDERRVVIDFAFPAERVAVEVDGFAFHSDPSRFRDDRLRQNALVNAGWLVLRFTWYDLVDDPHRVVHQVMVALASRTRHSRHSR